MARMTTAIESRIGTESLSFTKEEPKMSTRITPLARCELEYKVANNTEEANRGTTIMMRPHVSNSKKEFDQSNNKSGHNLTSSPESKKGMHLAASQNYNRTIYNKSSSQPSQIKTTTSIGNQQSSTSPPDNASVRSSQFSIKSSLESTTASNEIPSSYQLQFQEEFNRMRERLFRLLSKVPVQVETGPKDDLRHLEESCSSKDDRLNSSMVRTNSTSSSTLPSCSSSSVLNSSNRQSTSGKKVFSSGPLIVKYYHERSLREILDYHFSCSLIKHNFEQGLDCRWSNQQQYQQNSSNSQRAITPLIQSSIASSSSNFATQPTSAPMLQSSDQELNHSSVYYNRVSCGDQHLSSYPETGQSWFQLGYTQEWRNQQETQDHDERDCGVYTNNFGAKHQNHISNGVETLVPVLKTAEKRNQTGCQAGGKRHKVTRPQHAPLLINSSSRLQSRPADEFNDPDVNKKNRTTGSINGGSPLDSGSSCTNNLTESPYVPMKVSTPISNEALVVPSDLMNVNVQQQQHNHNQPMQSHHQQQYVDAHLYTAVSPQLVQCYPTESSVDIPNGNLAPGHQMLIEEGNFNLCETQRQSHPETCQPYHIDDCSSYYGQQQLQHEHQHQHQHHQHQHQHHQQQQHQHQHQHHHQHHHQHQQHQLHLTGSADWQLCPPSHTDQQVHQQMSIESQHNHQVRNQPQLVDAEQAPGLYLVQTGSTQLSCQVAATGYSSSHLYGQSGCMTEYQAPSAFAMFAPQ